MLKFTDEPTVPSFGIYEEIQFRIIISLLSTILFNKNYAFLSNQ